jgi:uncharacterized protein YndB with AHSA1/START domain
MYVFKDEWDVAAPIEHVFGALADARTYPEWWTPTYAEVEELEGELGPGHLTRHRFKGKLPYTLTTTSQIAGWQPPYVLDVDVDGDLRGTGRWTLNEHRDGTVHVRFDWHVHADRWFLKLLTPVLKPVFRWNHDQAIKAAIAGLEPWARDRAAVAKPHLEVAS